jgi:hypothetical protein
MKSKQHQNKIEMDWMILGKTRVEAKECMTKAVKGTHNQCEEVNDIGRKSGRIPGRSGGKQVKMTRK